MAAIPTLRPALVIESPLNLFFHEPPPPRADWAVMTAFLCVDGK